MTCNNNDNNRDTWVAVRHDLYNGMITAMLKWIVICSITTFCWVFSTYTEPINIIHMIPSQKPTGNCVGKLKLLENLRKTLLKYT